MSDVARVALLAMVGGCLPVVEPDQGTTVLSLSDITGTLNGEAFEGIVTAQFDSAGRVPGETTCTFTSLPAAVTAATMSPHA